MKRQKFAFTLGELQVVIAIWAVLMGIFWPTLSKPANEPAIAILLNSI